MRAIIIIDRPNGGLLQLIENNVAGNSVIFHHGTKIPQRIELNLTYSLTCYADVVADLLQRRASIAVQTEASFDDRALFAV